MTNLAVLGYGYWGPNIVRNLISNPRCHKVTICDINLERVKKALSIYPSTKFYATDDYQDILSDETIHGVIIATPISTHFELAEKAIKNGKHVFVEKPIAHSIDLSQQLIDFSAARKLVLMVGHTFIYSPPVIRIREIIKENMLGKLYYINIQRINLGLHQRDVNVIWDLGPHDVSTLLYWLDEMPTVVSAFGRDCVQAGIPDVCFMRLQFGSGVLCNISMSWLAPSKLRQTIIVGEKKMLLYDDTEIQEKVKVYDKGVHYRDPETFGEYQLSYRTGDVWSPHLESYEPLSVELDHFIDCIATGQEPKTSGKQGIDVVRILETADSSLRQGGIPLQIR